MFNLTEKKFAFFVGFVGQFILHRIRGEKKLLVFFVSAIIVIAVFGVRTSFSSPNIQDSQIIKDVSTKQAAVIAGQSVKYSALIKASKIKEGQSAVKLPKEATDIKITTIGVTRANELLSQKSANELTPDQRQQLAKITPQKAKGPFVKLASFLSTELKQTASDVAQNVVETVVPNSGNEDIVRTPDSTIVELSDQASPTPVTDTEDYVKIDYETPAPQITEKETGAGKSVTISAVNEDPAAPLTNVLAYSKLPEIFKVGEESKIKIKWQNNNNQDVQFQTYDLDNNGKLDYVEWTVPHLSEQTFDIIYISKAFQLDSSRNIIANIYDQVQAKDGVFATVPDDNYVRATFDRVLDNTKDITVYAKPTDSNTPVSIEVYPIYTDQDGKQTEGSLVTTFPAITREGKYRIELTGLQTPTDSFDLKVTGGSIDIDYIVDPSIIEFKHKYPGNTLTFTQSAAVGDVIVLFSMSGGATHLTATDNRGNTYTEQKFQSSGSSTITSLTAPVTTAGIPTITTNSLSDLGLSGWIVRGLSSATAHQVGGASGTGNPKTVSLTTTVECSLFIAHSNETANTFSSFNSAVTTLDNFDNTHEDASGHTLAVAAGSYTPGENVTSNANNTIIALYLPDITNYTYYWVPGGNGNWSSNTNWSLTSGGSGGAGVPTSADSVVFDNNSGTGASSVDAGFTGTITNFTSGTGGTAYGGSITLSRALTTSGAFTLGSGTFTTGANQLSVSGATSITGTFNITGAGASAHSFGGDITINTNGTWNNSGNADVTISGNITNNQTFTSGTGSYTLAGTSKTINGTISFSAISVSGSYNNTGACTVTTTFAGAGTFTNSGTLNIGSATVSPTLRTGIGVTWTQRASSLAWKAITSSSDGSKLAAVVNGGYIWTSTDSGVTWTTNSNSSGSRAWSSITSSSDGTKLAATVNTGDIYTSINSGVTWTDQTGSGSRAWTAVTSSSDGTKLAATVNTGDIYTSINSGVTWTDQTGSGSRAWTSITSSFDGSKLVATVNAGYIYTSVDSGVTWNQRASSLAWKAITSSSDGSKLAAVVNGGYIWTSTDSGVTWTTNSNSSGSYAWTSIASSSDGSKLVASVNSNTGSSADYIWISGDSGVTWTQSYGPSWWDAVASSSDGTKLAVACGHSGLPVAFIFTSTDSDTINYNSTTQTQTVKPIAYNNLSFNNTGQTATLGGAISVAGNLTITSGTLDSSNGNDYAVSTNGNWSNSGTFTARNSTVTLYGVGAQTLASGSSSFYNLVQNDYGGSYTLQNALVVNNDLTITAGTLDVSGTNFAVSVGGAWSNSGTFTAHSGTVILNGTNQAVNGSTTFSNLSKIETTNNSTDSVLTFQDGQTQTIGGLLTLDGFDDNDRINLVSSSPGNYWNLTASGSFAIDYVDVADSNAAGGSKISNTFSINSGHNVNWAFIPNAPTAVSAARGNVKATISFTPPADNGGPTITGYTVTSTPGSHTGTGAGSPIDVSGLTNGTSYTFTVHATNADGDSAESLASDPVTPATVPNAPTAVSAARGNAKATITFTAPLDNGGSAITGYTITSIPGSFTGTGLVSPIDVSGLTNGTSYTFSVHATNAIGDSVESGASNSVTPATVPGAPTGITVIRGDTQAIVLFIAPVDDGGSPITGYTVVSSPGNITASGSASPIIISGLTNGTNYTFTVYAVNAIGNSAESTASGSITPAVETEISDIETSEVNNEVSDVVGEIKQSQIVETESAPTTEQKKEDIGWGDFQFYAVLDSVNIPLNIIDAEKIEVVNNTKVLVEIPADIFAKKVNIITISTSDSTYLMNFLSDKNKYQAVIPMPAVKGDFDLKILVVYEDGTIKEIKRNISVDPQGYVYSMSSNYFGLGKKQEIRIADAKATLYKIDGNGYAIWDSGGKQPNPVITNKSGEYSFWVPNGEYFLTVEKAGYKTVKTDTIKVDNSLVIKNIPIELTIKPWVWLVLIGTAIAFAFLFVLRKIKMHKTRKA